MGSLIDKAIEVSTFGLLDTDFSGEDAARAQAVAAAQSGDILSQSAAQNIALQKDQLDRIAEITAPFRAEATRTALPQLSALALGGEIDYRPSMFANRQLEQGREAVLRQQAPGGIKSSRTFERLADLATGIGAEDLNRFEQGQRSILNPGVLATQQLGQVSGQIGANIGSIFSNLGQQQNLVQQNLAQAQAQQAANQAEGLSNLSRLFVGGI